MLLANESILINIEIYILLFFTYAFAGWFMESVGGIFKVKKFVNRGFLIGPYCPVYGYGVVLITLLLNRYRDDLFLLFVLSVLICGILEYLTSFFMEKLFNARWWDYHNRKFNINGRVCLETLFPFGFGGMLIIYLFNPIFIDLYLKIPSLVVNIVTIVLSVIYCIDSIISFIIILSFKGETYIENDNTEEISNKVKDKTEDILMKAESDAIVFGRRVKLGGLKFGRKVKYTRKKLSDAITYTPKELSARINKRREYFNDVIMQNKEKIKSQIQTRKAEFEMKQKETKEIFDYQIRNRINDLEKMQKHSKEKVDTTIQNMKLTSEEFTKRVKNKFKEKSILSRRLIDAFPNLRVTLKERKNNNEEEK